ncbi:MAG: tRNA pseudouridine(55) synthase TruB [Pyrinomonadaceae bacterium]|nr:tRNA pseudouridine(55) synthase TruB [Pyrinomonadaceae bacterium]
MIDGILIVDKPENFTSHDVVARLRRILKTKRIGHTGTLDPFATGVLVMLVGKATRLAQFLDKDAKEYEAVVRFGCATDTGDRTGELRITNYELRDFSEDELETVLVNFRGEIEQTPPMYSAKKVDGVKLYELARKGVEIERKPVKISIYELETISPPGTQSGTEEKTKNQKPKTKDHALRVKCSAGTYIRTLAEDIGRKLEVGAHLAELRRTKAGKFDLAKAVTIEELETIVFENRLDEVLISMNEAVSHLPPVVLSAQEIEDTSHGKRLNLANDDWADNQTVRMIDEAENLIAVGFYIKAENFIQPKLVLI